MKIVIEGRLPGLNEIIGMNRTHWAKGAAEKHSFTTLCEIAFRNAHAEPVKGKCDLYVTWYEKNRRRDHDNILAGLKFILDGAQRAGFIPNDNQQYIGEIHSKVLIGEPRVEIEFIETEK